MTNFLKRILQSKFDFFKNFIIFTISTWKFKCSSDFFEKLKQNEQNATKTNTRRILMSGISNI